MEHPKLSFYYFGELGVYDGYNPARVLSQKHVPEILHLIAKHDPYRITTAEIADRLGIHEDTIQSVMTDLLRLEAIMVEGDGYRLAFPAYLERDIVQLEHVMQGIGATLGEKVMALKDDIYAATSQLRCAGSFSVERILYHIICNDTFDDFAFDHLGELGLFTTSKPQPGDRDYIISAYEVSNVVSRYSDKLLCSSNNYGNDDYTFNSFGDSDGSRRDMYRFFRMVESGIQRATPFGALNEAYNGMLHDYNQRLVHDCGALVSRMIEGSIPYDSLSPSDSKNALWLAELGYVKREGNSLSLQVPYFYQSELSTTVKTLSITILKSIAPTVASCLEDCFCEVSDLTPIRHGVDKKDIANELWHLIFGATNEYLVKQGFVARPEYRKGEGRYLRSILFHNR